MTKIVILLNKSEQIPSLIVYATKTKNKSPLEEVNVVRATHSFSIWLLQQHPVFKPELLFKTAFPCHQEQALTPAMASTSSDFYPDYFLLLNFDLLFPYLTQQVRLSLAPYHLLCSISVTQKTSCYSSSLQMLPNLLNREVESISQVACILIVCFYSHMQLTCYQRSIVGMFSLYTQACHRILPQLSDCFEPSINN